jgi:Domain of unknown function (DUF1877).
LEGDLADLAEILFGDLDDEDAEMPEPGVDLDEAWHGVDCLLTGTAWDLGDGPAGEAILGGEEIGARTRDTAPPARAAGEVAARSAR